MNPLTFDREFQMMETFGTGVFIVVVVGIVVFVGIVGVVVIGGLRQRRKNNQAPVEHLPAKLVAKRMKVQGGSGAHTTYYATFELPGGVRREFPMQGQQYGLLAEGDQGMVSFQGTRFLGFERQGNAPQEIA